MPGTETPHGSLADRLLHRGRESRRAAIESHAGHPFVAGSGGTHPTERGSGGWVWMDDAYEAHVCKVCGRPEADPVHAALGPDPAD